MSYSRHDELFRNAHPVNFWPFRHCSFILLLFYLFRLRCLYRIDSLDLDLVLFLPGGALRRHPLDNRNSRRRLDSGCLRRRLRPGQRDLLRLGQKLRRIVRGYRRTAVLLPLRSGEHVTSAAIRYVAAEDAGDESSRRRAGRIAWRLWRRRRRSRTVAAKGFWSRRTVIIGFVPIYC